MNIRKHFLTMGVTKHWQKLPKEVVSSPSLEIFRSYLGVVPGNQNYVIWLGEGV